MQSLCINNYYWRGRHKSTTRQDYWTHDHMVSYMWCVGWGLEGSWLVWLGIFWYFLLIFIKYTLMGKKKKTLTASPITSYIMLSFLGSTLDSFTFAYFIEEQKFSLVLLCAVTLSCNCLFIYLFILINFTKRPGSPTEQAPLWGQEKTVYWYIGVFLGQNVP